MMTITTLLGGKHNSIKISEDLLLYPSQIKLMNLLDIHEIKYYEIYKLLHFLYCEKNSDLVDYIEWLRNLKFPGN